MAQDIVYLDTYFTCTQEISQSAAVGGVLGNCLILLVDEVNPEMECFAVVILVVVCFSVCLFSWQGNGSEE